MDRQSSSVSFAAIGHQDSWDNVFRFVNTLRLSSSSEVLSLDKIKDVFGYIPPRKLFDVEVASILDHQVHGMYIETFISPDELNGRHLRENLKKVKQACDFSVAAGADIVSLGGFSSIVLETENQPTWDIGKTHFTTGNTLTTGFIVKAVEKLCRERNKSLSESSLLVIGSTGDIGSACARYFARTVKQLLLCARQPGPLREQEAHYTALGVKVKSSLEINEVLPIADIIISSASSLVQGCDFRQLKPQVIICDAGYPKNILLDQPTLNDGILFPGGMGLVKAGYKFTPDHSKDIYDFPGGNIVHGCFLEGIVLAMEQRPVTYSKGRGNITVEAINEIVQMAAKHGIEPAILTSQ